MWFSKYAELLRRNKVNVERYQRKKWLPSADKGFISSRGPGNVLNIQRVSMPISVEFPFSSTADVIALRVPGLMNKHMKSQRVI